MKWFKYLGLLLLSSVLTELFSIGESLVNGNFFQGSSGLPLKFSDSSLMGGGYFNLTNFLLDVLFWFIVLLLIWKFAPKILKVKN